MKKEFSDVQTTFNPDRLIYGTMPTTGETVLVTRITCETDESAFANTLFWIYGKDNKGIEHGCDLLDFVKQPEFVP